MSIGVPHSASDHTQARQWLNKVPEVTLWFWFVKILSTTVGETFADFLNDKIGLGLTGTTLIMAGVLAIALAIQMQARRYVPWKYWLAVVLISIVGTLITDNMVDNWGISLYTCTIGFGIAMLVTFLLWYRREGTLSIHHIDSPAREGWYWLAILFCFALGTAAGDLIAEQFNLGYFNSVLLFGAAIGLVVIAWRFLGFNATGAFWVAYVLTRPLGASLGDLLSQPRANGGFGLGPTATSYVFLVAIVAAVWWMTVQQNRAVEGVATVAPAPAV